MGKNLKTHLDNILNNLCDTTPRQIFLTAAQKMHFAFCPVAGKQADSLGKCARYDTSMASDWTLTNPQF